MSQLSGVPHHSAPGRYTQMCRLGRAGRTLCGLYLSIGLIAGHS
jgi:hypothetical protein